MTAARPAHSDAPDPELVRALADGRDVDHPGFLPAAYDGLRRVARAMLGRQAPGFTLRTTDLLHAALLKVAESRGADADPARFFGTAVMALKQCLLDHVRRRGTQRRGGGRSPVSLADLPLAAPENRDDAADLCELLDRLAAIDERRAVALRLRYFGGLTVAEIAAETGVSTATVERSLRAGLAWLRVRWRTR